MLIRQLACRKVYPSRLYFPNSGFRDCTDPRPLRKHVSPTCLNRCISTHFAATGNVIYRSMPEHSLTDGGCKL